MSFQLIGLLFLLPVALSAQPDSAIYEIEQYRFEKEAKFRDPKESPLDKKLRKKFRGLKYYPVNLDYRVKARFVKTENPVLFKMKTTTTRLPEYQKYGEVHFKLDGQDRILEVYQSPEITAKPGLEDHLFIPFTDETNGIDTYEVGRYMDIRIPMSEEIIIDFNKSYNPYCSYGSAYSCPIPPEANHLPLKVQAGELKFSPDIAH
jgi:uncharacterized protein (DUF1684 family)